MEQLTISLDDSHAREDMIYRAREAIASLVQYGGKILPIDLLDRPDAHCEILRDEKGREFRYTSQYEIESGKLLGRIDIRYQPKE